MMHTVYKRGEGETTEWEDLQRKHGNLPEKEEVWRPEDFKPAEDEKKDTAWVDGKAVDELAEAEDDEAFADDRFMEEYRRRRIEELRQGAARPRFGSLETIRGGADFVAQVTNAGEGVWVVCHLFTDAVADCAIANACLGELAQRYPETKFVKIASTECIPGYPDENLPTLLLYRDGKCAQTLVGLAAVGGRGTSPDRVALALNCHGDVCGDAEAAEAQVRGLVAELLRQRTEGGAQDEDSDLD